MTTLSEAELEQAALAWLAAQGWQVAHGPDTLAAHRDALLPKLVSGEVRVGSVGA